MKPLLEKITYNSGSSFYINKFEYPDICDMPYWHVHPEYEIVFIKNGFGKRYIGNHISSYEDGDLIMIAPNLPHSTFSNNLQEDNYEVVIQFDQNFPGRDFINLPENETIASLLERSKKGLYFYGKTKETAGEWINRFIPMKPFDRLLELIRMLNFLGESSEYVVLSNVLNEGVKGMDYGRIDKVYQFVQEHYMQPIGTKDLALHINVTESAFCRIFKRHTHKTFGKFLNEFRIDQACKQLRQLRMSVSQIAHSCGFQSHTHFNKQFKQIVGNSPTEYSKSYEKLLI